MRHFRSSPSAIAALALGMAQATPARVLVTPSGPSTARLTAGGLRAGLEPIAERYFSVGRAPHGLGARYRVDCGGQDRCRTCLNGSIGLTDSDQPVTSLRHTADYHTLPVFLPSGDPTTADRHSGYRVGGTSPFGTRRRMPVYCEASIAELPRIYINGGKRGYIIALDPSDALQLLQATLVNAAQ